MGPNGKFHKATDEEVTNEAEPKHVTKMLGSAELVLPEHGVLISDCLKHTRGARELKITCADGHVFTCVMALASVSPFLRQILLESLSYCPGDWVRDEFPVLVLPDVTTRQMSILLSLLHTGTTQVHQQELSSLVTLTHLLKLISIPVAIVDQQTTEG